MTMKLLPLIPGVDKGLWPLADDDGEADALFRTVRPSVLERDENACRFCGFRDKGSYMQVHHRDGDHRNNGMPNLVTACLHCHAVHHLGLWGKAGTMSMVWLPEITQAQVSALSRSLLVARYGPYVGLASDAKPGTDFKAAYEEAALMLDAAKKVEDMLGQRAMVAQDVLGTSDVRTIANCLSAMDAEDYARRETFLQGFRFVVDTELPEPGTGRKRGSEVAERWLNRGGAFAGIRPDVWRSLGKAA